MLFSSAAIAGNYSKLAYDFSFNDIDGSKLSLSEFQNKVIIVVNVASQCGFTSQYEDMQKIWDSYQKKGVIMIGVPTNDFGNQEPGTNKEIKNFCEAKFGITFPITEKIGKQIVTIPIHPNLTENNIDKIITSINKFDK